MKVKVIGGPFCAVNDIKPGHGFECNGQYYVVVDTHHMREEPNSDFAMNVENGELVRFGKYQSVARRNLDVIVRPCESS